MILNDDLRYALRLAIGSSISILITSMTHIVNGYWITLTMIVCVMPSLGQTLLRSHQRIIGTVIGAILAFIIIKIIPGHSWPIRALLPVFIFLSYYLKPFSYLLGSIFITATAVLFINYVTPEIQSSYIRLICTVIGAGVGIAIAFIIVPTKSQSSLKIDFKKLYQKFSEGLSCILAPITPTQIMQTMLATHNQIMLYTRDINESAVEMFFLKKKRATLFNIYSLTRIINDNLLLLTEYHSEAKNHFIYQQNESFINNSIAILSDYFKNIEESGPTNLLWNEHITGLALIQKAAVLQRKEAFTQMHIQFASLNDLINLIQFLRTLKKIFRATRKLQLALARFSSS